MCRGADPSFTPTHGLQSVVLLLVRISMYAGVHVGIWACIYIYIDIYIYIYVYIFTYIDIHARIRIDMSRPTHTRLTGLVTMGHLYPCVSPISTYIHASRDIDATLMSRDIDAAVTTCMQESRPADAGVMTVSCRSKQCCRSQT